MSLVSIITPVYNASKYLDKVYFSLTAQTVKDWEWLVIDDCSKDDSFEKLNAFASTDSRIKVFKNAINSGPSISRNRGLDESKGEYVAFLDADDLWKPLKLEAQLKFMVSKSATFSCHNYEIIDEQGNYVKPVQVPELVTARELVAYNPLGTSFIMARKSAIGSKRFDPTLKRRQDWVFWFNMVKDGNSCLSLSENLGQYRKDSIHSISKNKVHMALIQWQMYRTYFHLGFFESILSFVKYAVYGVRKHYLK